MALECDLQPDRVVVPWSLRLRHAVQRPVPSIHPSGCVVREAAWFVRVCRCEARLTEARASGLAAATVRWFVSVAAPKNRTVLPPRCRSSRRSACGSPTARLRTSSHCYSNFAMRQDSKMLQQRINQREKMIYGVSTAFFDH